MNAGIILLSLATLMQQGTSKEKAVQAPFVSKTAGFSVNFPGPPTETFQTEKTNAGSVIYKTFGSVQGDIVYSVTVSDSLLEIANAERGLLFDAMLQGFKSSMNGTTVSENKITFQEEIGREVILDCNGSFAHAIYITRGRRIYQLLVIFNKSKVDRPNEFRKFADSFRLIKPIGNLTDGMERQTTWKAYRSKEGGFQIMALGSPTETTQKVDGPNGPVEFRIMQCTGEQGENFGITYSPFEITDPPRAPKIVFDSVANAAAQNLKGDVESRRAFQSQGFPASEAVIALPGNGPFKDGVYMVHMIIAGERFFQVIYVGPRARLQSKEVIDYFDSFKIDEALFK